MLYTIGTLFYYCLVMNCCDVDVELIGSADGGSESTGALRISRTDVRYNAVKDNVFSLADWAEVLLQTHKERHLVGVPMFTL